MDEDWEARIVNLKVNRKTSKRWIESLESWIPKQQKRIKDVSDKAEKDHENIEKLKEKLFSWEKTPNKEKYKDKVERAIANKS